MNKNKLFLEPLNQPWFCQNWSSTWKKKRNLVWCSHETFVDVLVLKRFFRVLILAPKAFFISIEAIKRLIKKKKAILICERLTSRKKIQINRYRTTYDINKVDIYQIETARILPGLIIPVFGVARYLAILLVVILKRIIFFELPQVILFIWKVETYRPVLGSLLHFLNVISFAGLN